MTSAFNYFKMSVLLKEIKNYSSSAAKELEKADFRTDSEIQSLTRQDLHELLPGADKLKARKKIFEIINKQKPVEKLLEDLKGFIPEESLRDALNTNGVLVDYLHLLKDTKAQLNGVQSFLEAHIGLLEEIKAQPQQQKHDSGSTTRASPTASGYASSEVTSYKSQGSTTLASLTASGYTSSEATSYKSQDYFPVAGNQSGGHSSAQSSQYHGPSQTGQVMVKYKMVVSGTTFDAHSEVLNKVRSSMPQLNLVETQSSEDCQIVLVFCPIVSRTGTDVDGAMKSVTDDKPVILVLMHHAHEAKHVATTGTWDSNPKIVKHVNVFFHERVKGLIACKENNEAISDVQTEVLKYGVKPEPREYSSGSDYNRHNVGINNNYGSSDKKSTGIFSRFYSK